jgi:hypothetical protein
MAERWDSVPYIIVQRLFDLHRLMEEGWTAVAAARASLIDAVLGCAFFEGAALAVL